MRRCMDMSLCSYRFVDFPKGTFFDAIWMFVETLDDAIPITDPPSGESTPRIHRLLFPALTELQHVAVDAMTDEQDWKELLPMRRNYIGKGIVENMTKWIVCSKAIVVLEGFPAS